jgi:hypothetical protein
MYLREMGTVPLLDREGEVEIAQRIEQGEWMIYEALCENPLVLRELLRLNELAQKDRKVLRELVSGNDPDEPLDPKASDRIRKNLRTFEQIAARPEIGSCAGQESSRSAPAARVRARDRPPAPARSRRRSARSASGADAQSAGRLPQELDRQFAAHEQDVRRARLAPRRRPTGAARPPEAADRSTAPAPWPSATAPRTIRSRPRSIRSARQDVRRPG